MGAVVGVASGTVIRVSSSAAIGVISGTAIKITSGITTIAIA